MRATALEFRLRTLVLLALILAGFWSPWVRIWGIGKETPLLEWLALTISRFGIASFTVAAPVVIVLASLLALLGAWLRLWGAAHLGPAIVGRLEFQTGTLITSGPYRYLRNPLYLGTWCTVAAIGFAMPVSGALFTVATVVVFFYRVILAEEAALAAGLGETYLAYQRAVPRIIPLLRTSMPKGVATTHWLHSVLSELNGIGIFVVTAVFSWRYDSTLMFHAVAICLYVALAARGFLMRPIPTVLALVCLGVLIESHKVSWYQAAIISFGAWFVLQAFLTSPQKVIAGK